MCDIVTESAMFTRRFYCCPEMRREEVVFYFFGASVRNETDEIDKFIIRYLYVKSNIT